jgi:hypothetical protein
VHFYLREQWIGSKFCLVVVVVSTKVDCSVENLTCVSKSLGFCISRRIFSVCCESATAAEIK